MAAKQEAIFITNWKNEMRDRINLRFKGRPLNEKKVEKYLDKLVKERMVNPSLTIENNYRNQLVHTDLLSLIDLIETKRLIIGGGGVLYVQHDTDGRDNIMNEFIVTKQSERNIHKAERKKYEEMSDMWIMENNFQLNVKILINALYGAHGYDGFALYNKFIAESITNIGRQIITTAVMTFEMFLANGVKYNTEEEVYKHIMNVGNEYDENMDFTVFDIDNIEHKVVKRMLDTCAFDQSDEFVLTIENMVRNLEYGQKVLLYYKNNLYEFSRLPFIFDKLNYIVNNLDELKVPDTGAIEDDEIKAKIAEIWEFYRVFVLYDYPIYDRVRKAMYTDRNNVLYVDTDSNFLGMNQWVTFIKDEVLENKFNKDEHEIDFISVNLAAIFLSGVIDHGLQCLAKYMNVEPDKAKRLNMKNEFYLDRIIFTDAKKRYISNSVLQEGKLLNGGIGLPDIKGFDFKKAGTKPYLKNFYTDLVLNDILRAKEIDVELVYKKIMQLKADIEQSMQRGESTFFKQATVNIVDYYKNPYSTQGVVAVTLWNTLNPQYAMDLPTDCDIIPIKELTGPKPVKGSGKFKWSNEKFVKEFAERFPDAYNRLDEEIYNNPNELIRTMGLTSIAKPKNNDIPIPEWFEFLINTEKVVLDSLNLITPVLSSLGLNGLRTSANTEYVSNVIDL